MNKTKTNILCGVALMLAAGSVYAEDTLLGLMQKIKAEPKTRVAYQETRTLKLMDAPWHGSGYLYSQAPDLMIREQLKPERLVMGVKGNQSFYFDPKNDTRQQGELGGDDNELSMPLAVFKALVNADEPLLHRLFDIEFSSNSQAWTMNLQPKQKAGAVSKIIVTGLSGQQANKISILQEDGDVSDFSLQKDPGNANSSDTIQKLYQESLGE